MKNQILRVSIILAAFLFANSLKAQDVVAERPFNTINTQLIPKGSFQIESGIKFTNYSNSFYRGIGTQAHSIIFPSTLFRIGIGKKIELRFYNQLQNNFGNYTNNNGVETNYSTWSFNKFEFGTKIQLYKKENKRFSAAIINHFTIPSYSYNYRYNYYEKYYTLDNTLSLAYRLGKKSTLGYSFSANVSTLQHLNQSHTHPYRTFMNMSILYNHQFNDKLNLFLETTANYGLNINAGFSYKIKNNVQWDFSYGKGVSFENRNSISTGISWNIGKKKEKFIKPIGTPTF